MSKMIIYFYLLIPLLYLSVDSSSIRGRNNKNELVPLSTRIESRQEKDNSLKLVNNESFIMKIDRAKETEKKETKGTDKKTKLSDKKRISKLKPLKKKHRIRRDLTILKPKPNRDEKSNQFAGDVVEVKLKNLTKNAANRADVLKALSTYPKRKELKRNEPEHFKEIKTNILKPGLNRNPQKHTVPFVKMVYPSTPKPDKHSHKYTYKDLLADRKRLEQKINYIKNMFNVNDTTADEGVRIRRRSESDRTANKIAKMFLTLSAVNGLHEKRRSKCRGGGGDDDEERVQDVWEKERRDSPSRKSTSSNEERYKVKKWIEFMKNKRSSGKTCPCMANVHGDDSDAFPLEQKLPKGYYLMERKGSSEESSEIYKDPYYSSRDPLTSNSKRRHGKDQDKLKEESKNGKKRLSLPLTDLELYRSRAKQILQNAEEILDRIKEEEERRLSTPNILMSQLKELTSRIHGDPRNNENDLIRKIQKNLGWSPLSKGKDTSEGNTFVDNVKSYILDPYEKAKALTDESTKMLSSYLLRNLGKMQESSEEQNAREILDETDDARKEGEKLGTLSKQQTDPLSKNKEELQHWEDTISTILQGTEENIQKEDLAKKQENIKNRMDDIIKEQQKKLNNYEITHESEETDKEMENPPEENAKQILKQVKQSKYSTETGTDAIKTGETLQQTSPDTQSNTKTSEDQKETPQEVVEMGSADAELLKKEKNIPQTKTLDEIAKQSSNVKTQEQDPREDKNVQTVNEKLEQQNPRTELNEQQQTEDSNVQTGDRDVLASPYDLTSDYQFLENEYGAGNDENLKEPLRVSLEEELTEARSNEETILEKLKELETELEEEQSKLENEEEKLTKAYKDKENANLKESFKDPTVSIKQDMKEPSKVKTETQQVENPLEFSDLMRETSQRSKESDGENLAQPNSTLTDEDKDDPILEKAKSNAHAQEETEEIEQNLQSQHENAEKVESEDANDKTFKSEENLKEPKPELKDLEEKDILEATREKQKTSNEEPAQKTGGNDENTKTINVETPLRATKDEKKETSENLSDETLLRESLETRNQGSDQDTLKEENPEEENDSQSLEKSQYDNDGVILQETHSNETPFREAVNSQTDQEDFNMNVEEAVPKEAMLEEENNELQEVRREDGDGMTSEVKLDEEGDFQTDTVVKATNPNQDVVDTNDRKTQNLFEEYEEILPKGNLNEETFLKSENPDGDIENEENQTNDGTISSEVVFSKSNENPEKGDEYPSKSEYLEEQLKNLNTGSDAEYNLKEENMEAETSRETPLKTTWDTHSQEDNPEGDETPLMKTNDEGRSDENSDETTSSEALDQFIQSLNLENDESDEASLKAGNPDVDNQKIEYSDEDTRENLKSGQENFDEGTDGTVEAKFDELNRSGNEETLLEAAQGNQEEENIKEISEEKTHPKAQSSVESSENLNIEMVESPGHETDEKSNLKEMNGSDETPLQSTLENEDERSFERMNDGEIYLKESNLNEKSGNLENVESPNEAESDENSTLQESERNYETPLRATLETQGDRIDDVESYLKESNPSEKSENPENIENEENVVFDTSEEQVRAEPKNLDNDKTVGEETQNSAEESLRSSLVDLTENSDKFYKSSQSNSEETENPLKTESFETDFDQKSGETSLKSVHSMEQTDEDNSNFENDFNSKDETPLKSANIMKETDEDYDPLRSSNFETDFDSKEDETSLKSANSMEQTNDDENPLKSTNLENDLDSEIGETPLKSENPMEQTDEDNDQLRYSNSENDFDNKIDETPLKSTNSMEQTNEDDNPFRSSNFENDFENIIDETLLKSENSVEKTNDPESSREGSIETLRADDVQDDFDNQIDEETFLKSSHDIETEDNFNESSYETLRQVPPLGENLIAEKDDANSQENKNRQSVDLLQIPDPTTKSLKPSKLKVPKSIAQIMRDLNGKDKPDITSIDNLNPDKIDHIIDKIDEAEHQQNLLETHEVDCRKECACADEIDTRSKNLGRYEIVKDFLHWMKDLQLNRVLTDD